VGKPEVKRTLGRPRRGKFYYITMDFSRSKMGKGKDLLGSGREEVAGCCECGNECLGSIILREFPD